MPAASNKSMNLEEELLNYLEHSKAMKGKTEAEITRKQRNIDLIAAYYGFRGAKRPTYDELAETYGVGSRQRVQQIMKKASFDQAKPTDFPVLRNCAAILSEREYWKADTYFDVLSQNGIVIPPDNVQGLLNLVHDLKLCLGHKCYTPDFREMTRTLLSQGAEILILSQDHADELRAGLKLATDRPGLVGIANLRQLADAEAWGEEFYDTIRSSIALSPRAWSWHDGASFWYTFEYRQTTLRTFTEKVFSVIEKTSPAHLAEIYDNALRGRTVAIPFPPLYVIERYLRESLLFKHEGELISYTGAITVELTEIDKVIVGYFKNRAKTSYPELRDYLLQRNFSKPLIDKHITSSCLIYVDRTLGRKLHEYSLVKQIAAPLEPVVSLDKYETYRERLRKLYEEETDENCESTRRKEHGLLQSWLFNGKDTEVCAICGDRFHVDALVTAHKKKRAICTTAERLDPHIVMPACALGCDFLYERGYIYVQDGKVHVNSAKNSDTTEYQRAKSLSGRTVPEMWLAGSAEYYGKPD